MNRILEICEFADKNGESEAALEFNVRLETVKRYKRLNTNSSKKKSKKASTRQPPVDKVLSAVREKFSDAELKRLVNGADANPSFNTVRHDFDGDVITFGAFTDTHLGSIYTDPEMINIAFDVFDKNNVEFIIHAGDVHEGLSHRPGHMYECSHIGYSAQLEHSREIFSKWTKTPIYMIAGNHDLWGVKAAGFHVVKELCRGQENLYYLGDHEGNIDVNGAIIKLWHGEDGSSYAFSYRIQKIIESFTVGSEPDIFVCGHTHKSLYMFDRDIHCVSAGALQKQSGWMRSKRASSHTGFYVIKMCVSEGKVLWFEPRFYPLDSLGREFKTVKHTVD